MDNLTPEQLQILAQRGAVGYEAAGVPLQAIMDYHTPVYSSPSEADLATALEMQKLRAELAGKRAERVNEATEIRIGGINDTLDAFASMADAYAKVSQASADVKAAELRGVAEMRKATADLAAGTRYQRIENPTATDAAATNMQTAVNGAVTEAKKNTSSTAWQSHADRLAGDLAREANNAVNGQNSASGRAGAWRTAGADAAASLTAYVAAASGTADQKQEMMTSGLAIIAQKTAAVRPAEDMLQSLNEQALEDENKNVALLREISQQYGLPAYLVKPFIDSASRLYRWSDPSDTDAMNQLASSASDWAVAPMDKALAELDVQIEQLTASQGDPFYASVSRFAEDHPWYETWRRASGFRNHEEAMRWITNHADPERGGIVARLDTLYDEESLGDLTVEGMRERLVQERKVQAKKVQAKKVQAEPTEAGARPDRITGFQTNALARAGDEIAGMFRRDPGAAPIPASGSFSLARTAAQQERNPGAARPTLEEEVKETEEEVKATGEGAGTGTEEPAAGAAKNTATMTYQRLRRAGRPYGVGDYLMGEVVGAGRGLA